MEKSKTPSAIPSVLKSLAIGASIGVSVGLALGLMFNYFYGTASLISVFAVVGIVAGCYYGSVVGYSNYRRANKLGL